MSHKLAHDALKHAYGFRKKRGNKQIFTQSLKNVTASDLLTHLPSSPNTVQVPLSIIKCFTWILFGQHFGSRPLNGKYNTDSGNDMYGFSKSFIRPMVINFHQFTLLELGNICLLEQPPASLQHRDSLFFKMAAKHTFTKSEARRIIPKSSNDSDDFYLSFYLFI